MCDSRGPGATLNQRRAPIATATPEQRGPSGFIMKCAGKRSRHAFVNGAIERSIYTLARAPPFPARSPIIMMASFFS